MSLPALRATRTAFDALPDHRQGLVAVLAAAMLWSTGGLFIKAVSLDALGVTMWRSLLAGMTILAISRTPLVVPWRAGWLVWALAVSYALTLVMFVAATKLTTAANAIFLQYTAPLYLLISGPIFLRERATRFDLLTVAVAFGGMCLFFIGRLDTRNTAGNVLAAASGMTLATMFTLFRLPSCRPEHRRQSMMLGNVILVVSLFITNIGRGAWGIFTPGAADIAGLIFLGTIQIGLAYLVFGFGVAHVPALEASLIGMLEPVLNPIWVFLALGESPGWWAVLGGAVIVAAVALRSVVAERQPGEPREEFGILGAEP